MLALHHFLDRERGDDIERHTGIVAFPVARSAFNHGIVIRHSRLLRGLRDIVDIGSERDNRLALSPRCDEGCRDSGDTPLDAESFLLKNAGEIFRGLELLESEFAKTEDAVYHDLS